MNSAATRLPARPPRVGELVEVRWRRRLLEAVEDAAPPAYLRVSLACADDDARGQTLEVYRDFEIDRRILEQEAWSAIGAPGFDSPRYFSAFLHTLRWNRVTATDPVLFQSPFRAGDGTRPDSAVLRSAGEAGGTDWTGLSLAGHRVMGGRS